MAARNTETSPLKLARVAALLYLLLIPFSVFGILVVPSTLTATADPAAMAANVLASEGLFRSGIVAHLIGQLIFVPLPLVLYRLLSPVDRNHALLMVVLALIAVPIAFINEINHFAVLLLLSGADYLAALAADQQQALASLFVDLRAHGIVIAQVFWGLWLLPLGYLAFKSGFLPRTLGVLVMIGGLGYVGDVLLITLFPAVDLTVSMFTFIGELALPLWLLIKGVDVGRWRERALASA